jgi:hypothetical protein
MDDAPRFTVRSIELFERDVHLRMPFRFGMVTLTACPQAFVRASIALADGRVAEGAAAEMMVPKWFDKDPSSSEAEDIAQLRGSLALARDLYQSGEPNSAFGHWRDAYGPQIATATLQQLSPLVAGFGPALVDRALLDALCRALGASFYEAMRANLAGIETPAWTPDLGGTELGSLIARLKPAQALDARHTVGLLDPLSAADVREPLDDGLPQTLEEVLARYGQRWFKLKVSGALEADLERLAAIAAVLDTSSAPYRVTLDGNEQFEEADAVIELWHKLKEDARLKRLAASVAFLEQPIARRRALQREIAALASEVPVLIDESDDTLDAFPRARALGYTGVSSKTCKGLYKSLINRARCMMWNREEGGERYFMSGEDLTVQAGIGLQQDLALVALLGIEHVERNGHHYVNGMAALPQAEQDAFLAAHPDLYERSHGAVRLAIREGRLAIGSLGCPGYASGALPDWSAMRAMPL